MRDDVNVKRTIGFWTASLFAATLCATEVQWEFPRTGSYHEGLPFADGRTGVLVWGGGDTINLTVGRGDLWDHRGGYPWTDEQSYTNICALVRANNLDGLTALFQREVPPNWNGNRFNPYLLPLGRITLRLPGAMLARGTLNTETGLGRLVLADGREVRLAMSAARHVFAMKLPSAQAVEIKVIPATDFPIYDQKLKGRGFPKAEMKSNGFTWQLPADESVTLAYETTAAEDGKEIFVQATRPSDAPSRVSAAARYSDIQSDSLAKWTAFWKEGARVKVPDRTIQQIYDFGMYKFGSMTDPSGCAAGLQGEWLEDDKLVPWSGDYHFNINVQECYSPAYRGGHFKNLMPLFKMVLSWRPRLRDNAHKFVLIDDGYVLPHSVDDRGVCIGGFWTGTIDHASTAWVASLMYRYVRYSGDVEFLRTGAYDFMKGAMNVYIAMMEEHEGRLSIPLAPSPEWGASDARKAVGRDSSFQLAAAHRLARDLIDAAQRLGETPDARWLDVEKRLPAYTEGSGGIQLFQGQGLTATHRHHSHLAGFYPFNTISLADAKNRVVADASYENWVFRGHGEWTGWCLPWAAILHTHFNQPFMAVETLRDWNTYFTNPGHASLHDAYRPGYTIYCHRGTVMQIDGQCAAVTAILELMAHEVEGETRYFRGCPVEWKEVSFENLALSDGTRVSGRRVNGKTEIVKATALPPADPGEIVVENARCRLVIGSNARVRSLVQKSTGEELLCPGEERPIFTVTQDRPFNNEIKLIHPNKRTTYPAKSVRRAANGRLVVGFELAPYEAEVEVKATDDYITFLLAGFLVDKEDYDYLKMDTPPVASFRVVQLPLKERRFFGDWLNACWDESVAIGVVGTSPYPDIDHENCRGGRVLTADLVRGQKLKGASAALIVADGREDFLDCMDQLERDFDLPLGVESRRSEAVNAFIYHVHEDDFDPRQIDRHIAWARRGGFKYMTFNTEHLNKAFGSWGLHGDYDWSTNFPNGAADLTAMLRKLKAAGIHPGLHFLHTHIGLKSRYVTPVADVRLNKTRRFTLAAPLPATTNDIAEITVFEPTEGVVMHKPCRILQFGGELLSYESYTTEPPYRFRGVKRGAWATTATAHARGEVGGILDVSEFGSPMSCYLDQNTDLQEEVSAKIAALYNCGFEYAYFDGSEGVNAPFNFHVSNAQYRQWKLFNPRPLFSEGAAKTHFDWHILSGANAFDCFEPKIFKANIVRFPVAQAPISWQDMTRVNFGWWNYFPEGKPDWWNAKSSGTKPDHWEFACSQCLAWDCPATILANVRDLEFDKATAEKCFEVMRRWNLARELKILTPEQKESLKDVSRTFCLDLDESGNPVLREH